MIGSVQQFESYPEDDIFAGRLFPGEWDTFDRVRTEDAERWTARYIQVEIVRDQHVSCWCGAACQVLRQASESRGDPRPVVRGRGAYDVDENALL